MKKVYINPTVKLVYIELERILAGSDENPATIDMIDMEATSDAMDYNDDDNLWD